MPYFHTSIINTQTTDFCLPEEAKTREVTMHVSFMVLVAQNAKAMCIIIGAVVHVLQTLITPEVFLTASATNRASSEPMKEKWTFLTFRKHSEIKFLLFSFFFGFITANQQTDNVDCKLLVDHRFDLEEFQSYIYTISPLCNVQTTAMIPKTVMQCKRNSNLITLKMS